jgi:A/G-specific adenine glycosylase
VRCPTSSLDPTDSLNPIPRLDDTRWRQRIRRRILTWFDNHRRELPWRRDRDPYRIWVSEVMLQQTQVATVIPFFQRFLNAFPTLSDLAAAREEDVLRLWEGLGYYRRARDLHATARQLAANHQAHMPDDPAVLSKLPGVGRYILGAVLSQAFDRRLPILEANSERVLCRLLAITDDPRRGSRRTWLWHAAEKLLPARRVGDFNQALMELGALICINGNPRCPICPLTASCAARRLGLQSAIPAKAVRPDLIFVQEVAVVVRRDSDVFLVQRPAKGRWANLWEFPHGVVAKGETPERAATRHLAELTGLHADLGPELLTIRHAVTRHRITLICLEARYRSGEYHSSYYQQGQWVAIEQLSDFPVSSSQRAIARGLSEDRQRRLL